MVGGFFGGQWLYGVIDQKTFPEPHSVETKDITEPQRGVALVDSIVHQMRYELNSTFGWTANDIIFNPYIMDNRAYRQFGVYNTTRILMDIYSRVIAKLGNNDREDENLYRAKLSHFSIAPSRWGVFGIRESAESSYEKGLKEVDIFKKNLLDGKAQYNCRTDDIHETLLLIAGDQVLGYSLGLLESSEKLKWYTLDNRIYEAQGMALVVRDFVNVVYHVYPQVSDKNNEDNFKHAMHYLNLVCNYDPFYIATNPFNSGAVIRSYLLNAKNRIEDIANSLRI